LNVLEGSTVNHRRRSFRLRRVFAALAALTLPLAALAVSAPASQAATATATATSDTSPVNLSTPVDKAAAVAARQATVVSGDARFEVLTDGVIRMEYSPSGTFLDDPTFDVLYRNFPVPRYTSSVEQGWLTIRTSAMALRYKVGSGPFSTSNTQVLLSGKSANGTIAASPAWTGECTFGQVCQSGAAAESGAATIARADHTGYVSAAGFISGYSAAGADATWQVLGAPAGAGQITVRYSNGNGASRTMSLVVNDATTQLTLPATASWDDWSTVTVPATLAAGTNAVAVNCGSADSCHVNIDDIAVTAPGVTAQPFTPADPLGGYIRSYDSANGTYALGTSCAAGQSDATCTAAIPSVAAGLLDKSGWYLLDDTQSEIWSSDGWIAPRSSGGDIEDGYLFGYGTDYKTALADLAKLTGPTPMLPENVFGNWLSRYYPYTAADYENTILPAAKANGVSLDALSVDTDWKSPNQWDGWEFNSSLFPDPSAFLTWAKSQGILTTFNIHASVNDNDPQYATAQAISGNTLAQGSCFAPSACAVFDWSKVAQAEAYFALSQPVQDAGAGFTWLDWCCDGSTVSDAGVTPDSWINHLYAQQMVNTGQRGFVLSRLGASYQKDQAGAYNTGAWADHTSTLAFTGDTWGTWNTLASEAQLAQDEGSIGQAYVSDDIGSFLGTPSRAKNDPDDLYLRWLELGAFQPIMRLHSDISQNSRLPWEYDSPTAATGDTFLQLREQLVPYTYTLSHESTVTGLPMARALYLDYPDQPAAYANPTEYLFGDNMLVAPVTTPGQVATTTVWFPPGQWTDYFTGATFTGPSTQTLHVPLDREPVFVKAGGIVPLQPSTGKAQTANTAPLTLKVYAGADGSYQLYQDAGTGLGYKAGQSTATQISTRTRGAATTVTIGAVNGSYPGAPTTRSYTVAVTGIAQPHVVLVGGRPVAASQWTYDSAAHTLTVALPTSSVNSSVTVTEVGGGQVQMAEPAAVNVALTSQDTTFPAGVPTKVTAVTTNEGPGSVADANVTLSVPSGWTVTPSGSQSLGSLSSAATTTWTVTAPTHYQTGTVQAVVAKVDYTDAASGQAETASAAVDRTPGPVTVTFRTKAPAGTPADATLYIVGDVSQLGNWDPGQVAMTNEGGGIWQTTITVTDGTDLQYKFTRGSWNTVEDWGSITGTTNRDVVVDGGTSGTMLVDDTSTAWSDTSVPDDQKAPEYWRDPLVVSTTPSDGSSGTAPPAVTVTFAQDITPTGSDYSGSVAVTDNGVAVAGTTTKTASGVLTWQPSTALPSGTYQVTVANVASANPGDNMPIQAPYEFSFTVS
jgi:alpha-glucosidase (family GH31 glycosyl hydrolase)